MDKIELVNIYKSYGGNVVFEDLNLIISPSGITAVTGDSGCGKSTLLQIVSGIVRPDSGVVRGMVGVKISYVFQEDRLLPWRSAIDNVTAVMPKGINSKQGGRLKAAMYLDAMELAKSDYGKYPAQLSGGMRQRVNLARALCAGGDLFLLDEPFKGLDEQLKERIIRFTTAELQTKKIVLVTHDSAEIALLSGEIVNLRRKDVVKAENTWFY